MAEHTKNSHEEVDRIVYSLREHFVERNNEYDEDIEKMKERLLELFSPLVYHVLDHHAKYHEYSQREDFEQDLKLKLVNLVYEWDDTRKIYFSVFVQRMLHTWVMKLNHKALIQKQRTADDRIIDTVQKDKGNGFEKEITRRDLREYIDIFMKDLTPKQKKAIDLRFFEELMVNEVANIQDVSAGAISNLIKRAFRTLKKKMEI